MFHLLIYVPIYDIIIIEVKENLLQIQRRKDMKERTIKITELDCDTYSKKDTSPRGCQVVSRTDVKVGDYIVIDNYFTLVVADGKEQLK